MTGQPRLRVLANLCSIVPGDVGGSEEYATRLLAAVGSSTAILPQDRSGSHPDRVKPPGVNPPGENLPVGNPTGVNSPGVNLPGENLPGENLPGVELEIAAMAGVRSAHPELDGPDGPRWNETRSQARNRIRRLAVESTWLARRSAGFDVVHHFGGRLPAVRSSTAVLTIHDVQPLEMTENYSLAKQRYLSWALHRSVRSAMLIVTPSQWTAARLAELLEVRPESIRVVPSTYRTAEPADLSAVSLPPRPFVLYPAATYPHKNHETLIAAHQAARSRCRDLTLVLTGGRGRAHQAVSEQAAKASGVMHLGRVGEPLLDALIRQAAALAFPSRYEGFGLPVLEAMAVGTPVIAADTAALPEVVADAGALIGPDDTDSWADALREAVDGSPEMRLRSRRGLARAERFTPDKSARRLLEAWHAAARVCARR